MTEQEDAIHIFKSLESFVRLQFGDSLVCMPVYTPDDDGRFIIIYCRPTVKGDLKSDIWCSMKYLPIFYIIGIVDGNLELSLKLITYHGKNVDELKLTNVYYDDNPSDYSIDKRKIEFIQRLNNLKLCQGVKFPDADITHSLHTLSESYLIECLENDIVLRSRHCTFAIPKDQDKGACDTCSSLSRKQSERKLKRAGKRRKNQNKYDEDDFTIFSEERNFIHPSQDDINTEYTKHEENVPNDEESEHSYLPDVYENGYTYDGGGNRDGHVLEYNDEEMDFSWSVGNPILSQVNEKQELLGGTDSVHDGLVESSLPDNKSTFHQCKQCSYQTIEKSELIMHISSVHRKMKQRTFKCKYCVHKTSNKSQLLRHIQDSHDPEKPYSCDSCQFKSKEKRTLVQHVVAVHDKTKSYLCEQCSYSTPSKGRLSCHIKAVHDKVMNTIIGQVSNQDSIF